jgi:DNA-binding MarR family transcriptional regulator
MSEIVQRVPEDVMLSRFRAAILGEVQGRMDLSLRQMAVALTVCLTDEPQTVRGMSKYLAVSKPAITRALDRLGELDLARRKVDVMDRRSVLVRPGPAASAMMQRLKASLAEGQDGLADASDKPEVDRPRQAAAQ